MVHVHARGKDGSPSASKIIYREIIERIREQCPDLIITVSTSGRRTKNIEKRMEVLQLEGDSKPDMASLTLGSLNFRDDCSCTPPEELLRLLHTMISAGIRPELEIFDTGMAHYACHLFAKGILKGTHYTNLFLGSLGTMPAAPQNLLHLIGALPEQAVWGATGVGRFSFSVQSLAVALGGHVRVGLEDSIYMDVNKSELATNEKLVMRIRKLAEAMEREIATPKEVRNCFLQELA